MTTVDLATLKALMVSAIDANESGDLATARSKARSAWMMLQVLPDTELQGFKQTFGNYRRFELLMEELRVAAEGVAGAASIRFSQVAHVATEL